MTLEAKIRRDLEAGPSTASALAHRCAVSIPAVETVLKRLLNEEKVRARSICDNAITVWSLTTYSPLPTPLES